MCVCVYAENKLKWNGIIDFFSFAAAAVDDNDDNVFAYSNGMCILKWNKPFDLNLI